MGYEETSLVREAAEKKRRGVPVFAVAFVLALVYMAGAALAFSLP